MSRMNWEVRVSVVTLGDSIGVGGGGLEHSW